MHLNGLTQAAAPLDHPVSCTVGARYCGLHRWLLARANARATRWRPCQHAHPPGGNSAAKLGRAPIATTAVPYRLFQPISGAVSDSNGDATAVHRDASVAYDHPNRQRHARASDAARCLR
jgi:hypothetical protein